MAIENHMFLNRKLLTTIVPLLLVLLAGAASLYRRSEHVPVPPPPRPPIKPVKPVPPPKATKAGALPAEPKSRLSGPVSLINLIVPAEDAVRGEWRLSEGRLITPAIKFGTIQLPCIPPEEYDIEYVAIRVSNNDSLVLGLLFQGRQCQVVLDGNNGSSSWLWVKEGKKGVSDDGVTYFKGPILRPNRAVTISVSVRKDRLMVRVDGFVILDWLGPSEKLCVMEHWEVPDSRTLFLGSWLSQFSIERIVLTAAQGTVGILR